MRAIVVALALLPRTAAAYCPWSELPPIVLTETVEAPRDGGIVIARARPAWQFTRPGAPAPPDIVDVAPGLHVYRLPAGLLAANLTDGSQVTATITTAASSPASLPAPNARWIKHVTGTRESGGYGVRVTVALDGPAPEGALALIVVDPDTHAPRSFGLARDTRVVVYASGKCFFLPEGTRESTPGSRVALRWLDKVGRLSPPTKAFVVARGKPEPPPATEKKKKKRKKRRR